MLNIQIKLKPGENAYSLIDNTIEKIKIQSATIEIKSQDDISIKYTSESNEEYIEKALLTKRELVALLANDEY